MLYVAIKISCGDDEGKGLMITQGIVSMLGKQKGPRHAWSWASWILLPGLKDI